jgi:hypothetical protein
MIETQVVGFISGTMPKQLAEKWFKLSKLSFEGKNGSHNQFVTKG